MNGGGAEKLLLRYIKILQKQRQIDMSLMILNGYGVLMQKIPSNVDVYIQNSMSASEKYTFNKEEFDVEIAFLESKAALFIANRQSQAIKVGWIHTDMLNNNWCNSCFPTGKQEAIYSLLDYIVCINHYCTECFITAFPSISYKTITCNNILDFDLMDSVLDRDYIMPKIPTFTFIGRLVNEKHPELAILALIELLRRGFDAKISFIGEGYLQKLLMDLCSRYGLCNSVEFLGYISNPYKFMIRCTAILSLSEIEGGPLTLAEGYYLGIPSISTHSGGADSFKNLYGGVVMTERNPKGLANIMESLMDNNFHKSIKAQIIPNAIRRDFSESNFLDLIDAWISKAKYKQG